MSEATSVVVRPVGGAEQFMPALSPAQAVERRAQMVSFVQKVMKAGTDFGVIPGTPRPCLLKPGAEKLSTLFGLTPRMTIIEKIEDWTGKDHGGEPMFLYHFRCQMFRGDLLVAECDGSCNSRETKYRYRKAERTCPRCNQAAIIKGKEEFGGGWVCFTKRGGCGAKFATGDPAIEQQQVGRVANPDIADQVNTILKMAQKRALVGSVLLAVNASEFFTIEPEDGDDDVPKGQREPLPDDDDAFRLGEDGKPDLAHTNTFTAEYHEAMKLRGFAPEQASTILDQTVANLKTDLRGTGQSWRAGLLNAIAAGKLDRLKPGEPSPALAADDLSTWAGFEKAIAAVAEARGIEPTFLAAAVELALVAAGCKGKPDKTPKKWRRDWLEALRAGAVDLTTGSINQVMAALGGHP